MSLCKLFDSRAHTIVSVTFTQNRRVDKTSMQSVINLVDLAGRLHNLTPMLIYMKN